MSLRRHSLIACAAAVLALSTAAGAVVDMSGYILDPNWYAPHPYLTSPQVYGTGLYEYGVAGNIANSTLTGFQSNTESYSDNYFRGIYGFFRRPAQNEGVYTLQTWDNWWRPTFVFNQPFVAFNSPQQIMRLRANMWSYAPTWEGNYQEFGQTFAASGTSVTMITVRCAAPGNPNRIPLTCTIHEGGPGGPQIGPSRVQTTNSGPTDLRYIWSGGEVPTVPGNIYYVKLSGPNDATVLCNNEPIPDMSDAMPEGSAYHNGVAWSQTSATPDQGAAMDLGITINSDDDGVLTNMFVRSGGQNVGFAQSVGQSFTARGTSLISFCCWIPDSANVYVATLYNGVNGQQIGTAKRNKIMRSADPELLFTWAPGECPLTPGASYYIEVTRADNASLGTVYANGYDVYTGGQAYKNRSAVPGTDLAGTIMEEESTGSATKPTVQVSIPLSFAPADRGANSLTVRWTTDVAADSTVEYAAWNAPYTDAAYSSAKTTSHVLTLSNLLPNTMYHLRVKSATDGYRTGVSRDFVACTTTGTKPNLLVNPGFESATGGSPSNVVPGWTRSGMDLKASTGNWFGDLPVYTGNWFLQGAINGSTVDAVVYQTVSGLTPGKQYNFTCALYSDMLENGGKDKYDVWNQSGRLDYMKIGIDPYGGNSPSSPNVVWTPRMYSHLHYTTIGFRATAQSSQMTVVISLSGRGGDWHLYGIDDCRLTEAETADATPPSAPVVTDDGRYTTNATQLHATWTASSDPESGISKYEYSIGTSAGATDVAGWADNALATSVTRTGLSLANGQTYYVNVRAKNGAGAYSSVASSDGITVAQAVASVGAAKALVDGSAVSLSGVMVSASFPSMGAYWVQDINRASGLRIASSSSYTPGRLLTVTGVLHIADGERYLSDVEEQAGAQGSAPLALGMKNASIGGEALNLNTPGVDGSVGAYNVGLLVMAWGRVNSVSPGAFYLDDGSAVTDGVGQGVRITGAAGALSEGDYAAVTGPSSTFASGGHIYRNVVARDIYKLD